MIEEKVQEKSKIILEDKRIWLLFFDLEQKKKKSRHKLLWRRISIVKHALVQETYLIFYNVIPWLPINLK